MPACPAKHSFACFLPVTRSYRRSGVAPEVPTGKNGKSEHEGDLPEIGFLNSVFPWAITGSKTPGHRRCEIIPLMNATIAVIPRIILVLSVSLAPLLAQSPGSQQQQPEFIKQGQQLMREGKLDDALALYRWLRRSLPRSEVRTLE